MAFSEMDCPYIAPAIASGFGLNEEVDSSAILCVFFPSLDWTQHAKT